MTTLSPNPSAGAAPPSTVASATTLAPARSVPAPSVAVPIDRPDQATRLRAMVEAVARAEPHTRTIASASSVSQQELASLRPAGEHSGRATRSSRIITVASGKGGVGKTNIAVNLAIALARQRLRVVLLDADLGVANADVLCGLHPSQRLDRYFAASEPAGTSAKPTGEPLRIDQIAIAAPGGFTLIPGIAGLLSSRELTEVGRDRILALLAELDRSSDVIVVDASPGVGPTVTGLLAAADLGLVITTPEPTAIADAYALLKCLALSTANPARSANALLVGNIHLLVNSAADRQQADSTHLRISGVASKFLGSAVPTAGWIARDEHVPAAVLARQPVFLRSPNCAASRGIERLAQFTVDELFCGRDAAQHAATTHATSSSTSSPARGWIRRLMNV